MSNLKSLARSAVGTGAGTLLYTVPRDYIADIMDITISNTTSGSLSVKIHLVDPDGSVAASNMMIPDVTIGGNEFIQWTGVQTLESLGFIQGIASGAGITVMINGEERR